MRQRHDEGAASIEVSLMSRNDRLGITPRENHNERRIELFDAFPHVHGELISGPLDKGLERRVIQHEIYLPLEPQLIDQRRASDRGSISSDRAAVRPRLVDNFVQFSLNLEHSIAETPK